MGRNDERRKRLLRRKVFKNYDNWEYEDCFVAVYLAKCFVGVLIGLSLITDCIRNYGSSAMEKEYRVSFTLLFFLFCTTVHFLLVVFVFYKVSEKYFKICSFLAILQIFLIVFIVFHPFQTFVPGPRTEKLEDIFKFSFHATYIWIPALTISLFSCAIILWKASDQSELYTVILDGKRSSTKIMDP